MVEDLTVSLQAVTLTFSLFQTYVTQKQSGQQSSSRLKNTTTAIMKKTEFHREMTSEITQTQSQRRAVASTNVISAQTNKWCAKDNPVNTNPPQTALSAECHGSIQLLTDEMKKGTCDDASRSHHHHQIMSDFNRVFIRAVKNQIYLLISGHTPLSLRQMHFPQWINLQRNQTFVFYQ